MLSRRLRPFLGLALLALTSCGGAPRDDVLVFAAASLRDALTEVGSAHEEGSGARVAFHFAGSTHLARQVELGAPADLIVSAARGPVASLEASGRLVAGTLTEVVTNELVVVCPRDRPRVVAAAPDLLALRRIAIADPAAAPAGAYARAWLEREGVWSELADRIVPTLDVRAALAAAGAGSVDCAVVYATDAASTDRVVVAHVVPRAQAPPVAYVAGVVSGGREEEARRFLASLAGDAATAAFLRHGFRRPEAP